MVSAMSELSGRGIRENQRVLDVLALAIAHENISIEKTMHLTGIGERTVIYGREQRRKLDAAIQEERTRRSAAAMQELIGVMAEYQDDDNDDDDDEEDDEEDEDYVPPGESDDDNSTGG